MPQIIFPVDSVAISLKRRVEAPASQSSPESSPESRTKPLPRGILKHKECISALVEQNCPSLVEKYTAPWFLFNGHMQTLYCIVGDFTNVDPVVYRRGLDFTPPERDALPDDTPIVVVSHGLTGGSHEGYIRAILSPACTPKDKGGLGYRAVVVNFRGCAGVPITSQNLYSAGNTNDLRTALLYISKQYPRAPLLGLGFSLGANVMIRYMGEEGAQCRLLSGCALGCPWNLAHNGMAIAGSFMGKFWTRGMGNNMVGLVQRHATSLSGRVGVAEAVSEALALRFPALDKFDLTFTRVLAGYPTEVGVQEYYAAEGSHDALKEIRRPLLAINAADDPVVQSFPKTQEEIDSDWTTMVITPGGGHLGWFEPVAWDVTGTKRWTTKPVLE
ncbi:hypothetical protein D9758_007658 [Tetrapyrgos nigripes]|uniref:AB hydrolase-1 domain-containing protein n=1 Tax=Tetrapyrgos nigripes TaxID=182062 RepID=A0A8H5LIJ6_9AGAR|nr:hypothetical protein D9758_007658 [Tetrapyrgos nigripes]